MNKIFILSMFVMMWLAVPIAAIYSHNNEVEEAYQQGHKDGTIIRLNESSEIISNCCSALYTCISYNLEPKTRDICHIHGISQGEYINFYVDTKFVNGEYSCTYAMSDIFSQGEAIEPNLDDELQIDIIQACKQF